MTMHNNSINDMKTQSSSHYSHYGYDDDHYWYQKRTPSEDNAALTPLIKQLQKYDMLRHRMEQYGGNLLSFKEMTRVLNESFTLKSNHYEYNVALNQKQELKRAIHHVCHHDYILDVRRLDHTLPVYYLCRVNSSYWSNYTLIVQDLYCSNGYPMHDERFIKLMYGGHESLYLRLSPYRDKTLLMPYEGGKPSETQVDDLFATLGNHIFEAAWHEDQRPGFLAATYFNIPNLRNAIELLYLCLTSELCELRGKISPPVLEFMTRVYPQPAIRRFLEKMGKMSGSDINDLPERVLKLYAKLNRAFGRFLETNVEWGVRNNKVPLYKLMFSNFTRIDMVTRKIAENENIRTEAKRLDRTAREIILQINEA